MICLKCPKCGSKNIVNGSTKEKHIEFELGFAPIKCRIGEKERYKKYKCLTCGHSFHL